LSFVNGSMTQEHPIGNHGYDDQKVQAEKASPSQ
jgi:hypothetical protein